MSKLLTLREANDIAAFIAEEYGYKAIRLEKRWDSSHGRNRVYCVQKLVMHCKLFFWRFQWTTDYTMFTCDNLEEGVELLQANVSNWFSDQVNRAQRLREQYVTLLLDEELKRSSMKFTKIPKGYRLIVSSWENDGDHSRTEMMDGLSKEDTKFLVELIGLLESKNGKSDKVRFGNMYDPEDKERIRFALAIQQVAEKHAALGSPLAEKYLPEGTGSDEDQHSYMDDAINLLYDLGLSGGEFYTRVTESYKVEYLPEDVKIQDVTGEF